MQKILFGILDLHAELLLLSWHYWTETASPFHYFFASTFFTNIVHANPSIFD